MENNKKPKVVFTYVEAGLGHIMAITGIYETFLKKYGDKCDVVKSYIFSGSKRDAVVKMGKAQDNHVKKLAGSKLYNKFECFTYKLSSKFTLWTVDRVFRKGRKAIMEDFREMQPDLLVSSYYLPSHLIAEANKKGITNSLIATYLPDNYVYPAWDRNCDMFMVNSENAYNMAINKGFKKENVVKMPFLFRKEIQDFNLTKEQARKELSLDNGKFTVLCAMGAFGVKKAQKLIEKIIDEDLDINFVVICGKNQALLEQMNGLKATCKEKLNFVPVGFTNQMAGYIKASDLVLSKSSFNTIMEVKHIGTPMIAFSSAGGVEHENAKYFSKNKMLIREDRPKKIIELIKKGMENPDFFNEQAENFEKYKLNVALDYGADKLFELLKTRFPEL